jgi:transcriptional regulator with XRE-family HTH domain
MRETKPEHKEPTLGRRVASQRALKDWTQAELGEALGITPTQVWRIENGQSNASVATLRKLASLFGVTIDWLLRGEEEHVSAA